MFRIQTMTAAAFAVAFPAMVSADYTHALGDLADHFSHAPHTKPGLLQIPVPVDPAHRAGIGEAIGDALGDLQQRPGCGAQARSMAELSGMLDQLGRDGIDPGALALARGLIDDMSDCAPLDVAMLPEPLVKPVPAPLPPAAQAAPTVDPLPPADDTQTGDDFGTTAVSFAGTWTNARAYWAVSGTELQIGEHTVWIEHAAARSGAFDYQYVMSNGEDKRLSGSWSAPADLSRIDITWSDGDSQSLPLKQLGPDKVSVEIDPPFETDEHLVIEFDRIEG
ncbi:hypothetical protein [Pelagovum pacificum]|uniref:Uncharacterized protein n=1 Tax=Pelagovum pacificum TaxID=2588711 RepID=A0A5C5GCH0_9RHOB|nr:hypothetical protein [Pelagovum pacificum]QQA44528.1 hypothetical protein I8N54_08150 [Pelagovum pacificum]TNY32358.1 hypothetical protein FHY64_03430 [Pelagovum pacificum]